MLRRARDQGRIRALLRPKRRVGYRLVIFLQTCTMMWHRQHSTCRHRTRDSLRRKSCSSISTNVFYLTLRTHSTHLVVPREPPALPLLPLLPLLPDLAPPDDPEELPELPEDEPDEPDDDECPPPLDPPPPLLFSR